MQTLFNSGALELVLDQPKTSHAFSLQQARELSQALDKYSPQKIILKSTGRIFCSGGDLQEYAKMTSAEQGLAVNKEIREVLGKLYEYPAAKLAVVTGDCFGGGIELVSCFQWIYAVPEAFFGLWQRKQGLSFGWGGYGRLQQRMSAQTIKSWLLEASFKSAHWCYQEGLADHLVISHKMPEAVEKWSTKIDKANQVDVTCTVYSMLDQSEVEVFEKLWWSDNHQNRLKKFNK